MKVRYKIILYGEFIILIFAVVYQIINLPSYISIGGRSGFVNLAALLIMVIVLIMYGIFFIVKRKGRVDLFKRLKTLRLAPHRKAFEESILKDKNFPYNVFISYSTLDSKRFKIPEIAKKLSNFSEIEKVSYWEEDSGENIVHYMEKNIKRSEIFILFCSENSINSASVEGEWQAAYQLQQKESIKVITVYEDEQDIPILLFPMPKVVLNQKDFDGFIVDLYTEIMR